MIYLDNNATAPLAPEVAEAMRPWLEPVPANPSSVHVTGQRARDAVERARADVASLLGVEPAGVVFTSGGTESDNTALWGALGWPPAGRLLVSAIEHPAVIEAAAALGALGVVVELLPVDADGRVEPAAVSEALTPETTLVSVMAANNEVGALQPIEEIGALCRERGVLLHCDAVQAAPWLDLAPLSAAVDLLTITAHKMAGPPGIGVLWVRPGVDLQPLLHGGGQQGGRRPGTEPTALIVGLGATCRRVARERDAQAARVAGLRDRLERSLLGALDGARRNGAAGHRLPNTASISIPRCDGQALVARLDVDGLAASAGSACASGVAHGSHVLQAMGVPDELRGGALRLSLGYQTTEKEIDDAARIVPAAVRALRDAGVEAIG